MILLMLAAFAQTPSAPATTRDSAMTCAAATIVSANQVNLRVMTHSSYFGMQATRADQEGKPFLVRFQELMTQIGNYAAPLRQGGALNGRAPDIVAACDRAYPLARTMNPPPLPPDPFERDALCLGIIALVEGMGRQMPPGDAPGREEILAAQNAFIARLPDSRTRAAGFPDQQALGHRIGELIGGSIDLGNSEAVSRSCLALLRG